MSNLCNSWLIIIISLISQLHLNTVVASENGLSFSLKVFGEGYKGYNSEDEGEDGSSSFGGAWSGKNETSGTGFESAEGQQVAFSGVYQYGDYYTGLNVQLGESYRFEIGRAHV